MNEGSGGRGEIPQQDSNTTGKEIRGRSISLSLEEKVESWMAFKLSVSSSHLSIALTCIKNYKGRVPCWDFKDIQKVLSL